jgi:transposase-like protein
MTEKELARGAARRLAIIRHAQEVTGNVSLTCRYFGITRQASYKWLRRHEDRAWRGSAPYPHRSQFTWLLRLTEAPAWTEGGAAVGRRIGRRAWSEALPPWNGDSSSCR